ncbi:MAG: threonine/serine dehydratase [Deltaproteobacteria bacterium]|nr:threonine/serine dehydratase [Deltaproteobacteria bacterium]
MPWDVHAEVVRAAERLRGHVALTPARRSAWLSRETGADVWLKLECVQHTGSFKLRGALNALLSLTPAERASGVVAASSGNHGVAVAHGAEALGARAVVFVPESVGEARIEPIRQRGAEVVRHGAECGATEAHARAWAAERGMTYLSPYNDACVVAGQGTVGLELTRQVPGLAAVYVSVGGGGLVGGIGAAVHALDPGLEVVGCSPDRSPVMQRSVEAGAILDMPIGETFSESTAGGIEPDTITFELCRRHVDRWLMVPEAELGPTTWRVIEREHVLIEGAAAVAVAAAAADAGRYRGRPVAIVLCGANVTRAELDALRDA